MLFCRIRFYQWDHLQRSIISFQMKMIAIVFSLLLVLDIFGQDCNSIAKNKFEPWRRTEVMYATPQAKPGPGESAKMKSRQDKIESWIRSMLTGFTGAKVGYSNEYFLNPLDWENDEFYKVTGIKGHYGSTTRFWAYYCYDNSNTVHTEGEAGSFIYVKINTVFHSDLTQDVGVFTINGKSAFRVLEKSHSEGRVDYYDRRKRMNYNDTVYTSKRDIIIIRNSDKPVFIPITRKEYLQQMLKDAETYRAKEKSMMMSNFSNNAKVFEEEMKSYKLDRLYTPEKEAKRRQWFKEDQAKIAKVIDKIDPDVDAFLEVIKRYLQKPAEWLNRHFRDFYSYAYTAKGVENYFEHLDIFTESKEDYTRSEVVSISPDYFNKALSNDVPQLMMVELVKNGYWYMYKVSEKVKQPGGLASLIAIVNPGKSARPETYSTCNNINLYFKLFTQTHKTYTIGGTCGHEALHISSSS